MVKTPHQTYIEISQPISPELDVGAHVTLKVNVSCSSACDLRGAPISITAQEGVLATSKLAQHTGKSNETGELTLQAPKQAGEFTWRLVFPRYETHNVIHEEVILPICFRTLPHKTSITVWDVPSPVVMNSSFNAKVGIKCAAGCRLTGQVVEVRDEAGNKMGDGKLSEAPWQGTDALYWAEATIASPIGTGMVYWAARFGGTQLDLAHEEATANFSFRADTPPEHRVTIAVIGADTQAPIENAEARLGFYTTFTDERGMANFEVPKGMHDLKIWKDGYRSPPMIVDVIGDATIRVEALKVPTEAEVEEGISRFEASTWG